MSTKAVLPPIQDNVNPDHRYRGYIYDLSLRNPRIPITGPITFRNDITSKKFPLPANLVNGQPVPCNTPPQGFLMGSDNIREISAAERNERKINLRLLEKTSADLRKSQKAQDDRESFMKEHKRRKQNEERMRLEEKEQDLKLLQQYNPFGKPGYGAPRGSGKDKTAMTKALRTSWGVGHVNMDSEPKPEVVVSNLPPLRVKPRVRRYEDDRMRRYAVGPETAAKYRKDLDEHQEYRRREFEKIKEIDKRREANSLNYDPFGKPGAGAPNRDKQGNSRLRRSVSLSYANNPDDAKRAIFIQEKNQALGNVRVGRKFIPREAKLDENNVVQFDPWGKDNRRRDKDGNIIRFPRTGDHGVYEFVDPNEPNHSFPRKHLGGGGEPLLGKNGDVQTKRPGLLTTIHGARRTENINRVATPEEIKNRPDNTSPWGKPGAGAPLKDDQGNIVKNTKGRINQEATGITLPEATKIAKAKQIYRKELQEGMAMQMELRDEEKRYQQKPPGDVPSWFSKGQVGRPRRDPETGLIVPQRRIMSDVTAQKLDKNRPRDVEGYYKELEEIAQEKKKKRYEEKARLASLEAKHFATFAEMFEKPGNGAPNLCGTARHKFSTSAFQAQPQKGTQVLPSHHQTTLQSAINLPYDLPLDGDPAQFQTEYDHYNFPCKTPVPVATNISEKSNSPIKSERSLKETNSSIRSIVYKEQGSEKSRSSESIKETRTPVVTQIYESKSAVSEKVRSPDQVKHDVTPASSVASQLSSLSKNSRIKRSTGLYDVSDPYKVVAPWAIDG